MAAYFGSGSLQSKKNKMVEGTRQQQDLGKIQETLYTEVGLKTLAPSACCRCGKVGSQAPAQLIKLVNIKLLSWAESTPTCVRQLNPPLNGCFLNISLGLGYPYSLPSPLPCIWEKKKILVVWGRINMYMCMKTFFSNDLTPFFCGYMCMNTYLYPFITRCL